MASSDADYDYALALQIQDMDTNKNRSEKSSNTKKLSALEKVTVPSPKGPIGIVDPYWELADPNPNVYELFMQFDSLFFDCILNDRGVSVKWSPRMTLCAGLCKYEGRGGLCSVHLSTPLLKLRPRKDLIETLLHEMIHAFLFVTENYMDHDGHGPKFQFHMNRINKASGTNITIYHTFHDEVKEYRQHWWRCKGICRTKPPFFGYVKRAMNRAPAPHDSWWGEHQRTCGGAFEKVKEPENYKKKLPSQKGSVKGVKGKEKKPTKTPKDGSNVLIGTQTKPSSKTVIVNGVLRKVASIADDDINEDIKFPGRGVRLGYGSPLKSPSEATASVSSSSIPKSPHGNHHESPPRPSFNDSTSAVSGIKPTSPASVKKAGSKRPLTRDIRDMLTGTLEKKPKPVPSCGSSSSSSTDFEGPCSSKDLRSPILLDPLHSESGACTPESSGPSSALLSEPKAIDVVDLTVTSDLISCPVCGLTLQESLINAHLDECLAERT